MATIASGATAVDLLKAPDDGRKHELVDGKITVGPAGGRHGRIAVRLVVRLGTFVAQAQLGEVFDSSTGFTLKTANVRAPDVSFVAKHRFPGGIPEGFIPFAPDLAVEILSPDDSLRQVMDKVGDYFESGVALVWVVDPRRGTAAAYRSLTDVRRIAGDDSLDGEDVVPGFSCVLSDILG